MTNKAKTNLLIRMDRIGDLVLTLPMDRYFPGEKNIWLITKGIEFVPENAIPSREFKAFEKKFSLNRFWQFLKFVKNAQAQLSITFHAPWWVNLALFIARVPRRVGVLSQWHSFLFLNAGLRQKRSQAEKHEAHYNLDLVSHALGESFDFSQLQPLKMQSTLSPEYLQKWNLTPQGYFVVHPGMGGSALNWPIQNYEEIIQKLALENSIVITGTAIDASIVEPLKKNLILRNSLSQQSPIKNILFLDQKLSTPELLLILKNARGVLSPSTGVAHLAAALGTHLIGLYSPVLVERALRWGPLGENVQTLTPAMKNDRLETGHTDENVMAQISVDDVYKKMRKL